MIIPVVWKTYKKDTIARDYWDQAILEDLFSGKFWSPSCDVQFEHYYDFETVPKRDGVILILPARHNADRLPHINKDIAKFNWVLVILCGDEEAQFPTHELKHPNMKIWLQTPHMDKDQKFDRLLINGYAPETHETIKELSGTHPPLKDLNWFFAGQVTHKRRKELVTQLADLDKGICNISDGFTKGLPRKEYLGGLRSAKVALCPSGAVIPDSFRVYEALEAGCLPLLDGKSSILGIETHGYWNYLFNEDNLPVPVIGDWTDVAGNIQYHVDVYPRSNNRAFAWWQRFKRQMYYWLLDDLAELTNTNMNEPTISNVTVLIPTSPITVHPDTSIIEETIGTVRFHHPEAEIIIMFDGIRAEQMHLAQQYEEYKQKVLWMCNYKYKGVVPLIFDDHTHQAEMTRKALKLVRTKLILFVEHDTPIVTDESIPWEALEELVVSGQLNVVRLHHEALILDDHKSLMLDDSPIDMGGVPIARTAQWSQRPHLANTEFYRWMLAEYFSNQAKTMIEDRIHGFVIQAFEMGKLRGWNQFKVGIYAPEGNMKRSYHIDGRATESKFEDTFVY